MKRWMLFPLAVLMLWPANLAAQEEASPTWWALFTEQVAPADIAAFEEATAAMYEVIKANAPEDMVYYTLSGPETGFMYAIPMESYEQFMQIGDKWEGMVNQVGREKWMEMDAAGSQYVTSRSMNLYIERMDLSYVPESPRLTADEAPMRHYDYMSTRFRARSRKSRPCSGSGSSYTSRGTPIRAGWCTRHSRAMTCRST